MRKCEDCLHYSGKKIVIAGADVDAEYCIKHIFCIPLKDSMLHYFGCDDFWPKDGAKCETCRFGTEMVPPGDQVVCHLWSQDAEPFYYKVWYCEKWRAKK